MKKEDNIVENNINIEELKEFLGSLVNMVKGDESHPIKIYLNAEKITLEEKANTLDSKEFTEYKDNLIGQILKIIEIQTHKDLNKNFSELVQKQDQKPAFNRGSGDRRSSGGFGGDRRSSGGFGGDRRSSGGFGGDRDRRSSGGDRDRRPSGGDRDRRRSD